MSLNMFGSTNLTLTFESFGSHEKLPINTLAVPWKNPGSLQPKKFGTEPLADKVIATVFRDSKGIILIDYKKKRLSMI